MSELDGVISKGTGEGTNASGLVRFGRMFYIINPIGHTHQFANEVPDYVVDVSNFVLFISY